jgi:lysosomal alpha-mannosidase
MFTMGDDFTYQNAAMYYKNMDKLIRHMNERTAETKINLLYSTPSCFVKALNDANDVWPTKTDDFFPYASGTHCTCRQPKLPYRN